MEIAHKATAAQRDCLSVLFGIYADRALSPRDAPQPTVVLTLSSVGWRRFARDLLRVGGRGKPVLPMSELLEAYRVHATQAPLREPMHTFAVAGVPPSPAELRRGDRSVGAASFETFVSTLGVVASR